RLIFQLAKYFAERRINNMLSKIVVLNHPGHVQSFDKDRLVLADDLRGEFLKRVPAGVTDFGVQFSYFKSGLLPIVAVLDLARQTALKSLQSLFAPEQWARIFEFIAVAGRGQRLDAYIYADFGFDLLEQLDSGFNEDADKIASARIPADRQAQQLCIFGKRAAPSDIQRLGLLGESDLAVPKCEGIGGVASRLARSSRFEGWILRPFLEEIREGCIEIAQRLLKDNRTDLGKKDFLRRLLPFSEFGCGVVIANGFLLLLPGGSTIFQSLIVNIASAAEGPGKLRCLLISGEESVFEGLLHYHGDILHYISGLCKRC
ncbi:MAG TPA: hypothetical protein VE715_12145, partial [Blastocatellia bacterium]|nr:hypothetical protein [Blastocatellia bacterium]